MNNLNKKENLNEGTVTSPTVLNEEETVKDEKNIGSSNEVTNTTDSEGKSAVNDPTALVMHHMTKEHVLDVMSVPSYSRVEYRMTAYIMLWARQHNIDYDFDKRGNIYLTKGTLEEGEFYPCVTSHLDTVQDGQVPYAETGTRLNIKERINTKNQHEIYVDGMGIGGDCRAGITICLALIEKFDKIKACFFLEEEMGMLGSKELDVDWFNDVGYVIGYDSPELNRAAYRCSQKLLFTRQFFVDHIQNICKKWGLTVFNSEPITDVVQIREKTDITCMNFGNGGYQAHSHTEYCVLEDMDNACGMGEEIITHLGCNKYVCNGQDEYTPKEGETAMSTDAFYDKVAGRQTYNYYGNGYNTGYGRSYSGGNGSGNTGSTVYASTQTKSAADIALDKAMLENISKTYEKYIENIKDDIKKRCELNNIDYDAIFANVFDTEITF